MQQRLGNDNQHALFGPIDKSPWERFMAFHLKNPQVYNALVEMAFQAKDDGSQRYSMRALWEVYRWRRHHGDLKDPNQVSVKLNDHYAPHYARLIEKQNPELEGFFEKRRLRP